ncbi:MAG: DUF177 domain-containing protein [Paucibacter sp.]|nr:DUF177 domain-containing protein [Roseateles sp.]
MKNRVFSAAKLDVEAFAHDGASLEGQWPATELERLADAAAAEAPAAGWPAVNWLLEGEARARRAAEPEIWLHLQADAQVSLTCQRCLRPVREHLEVDRSILFVRGEDEAASLDADSEDDVLALPRHLDAKELIEDELLLALPLVPRHDSCPQPLSAPAEEEAPVEDKPNPFAALKALKKG